jgi:integrase
MSKITREHLQSLLGTKAKVLAHGGVDHLRFRLRSIFELAVSEGVVDRNPAVSLFTPRNCQRSREKLVLTPQDIAKVMEPLELRERLIVRLATFEGMRPGENLGLQVLDVDGNSVWVRRRLYKGNIDLPKTRRSARQVALSAATVELLGQWSEKVRETRPEAWLFPAVTLNSPVRRDNVWRRNMLPKMRKIGMDWATFEVMRRTFATLSKQPAVRRAQLQRRSGARAKRGERETLRNRASLADHTGCPRITLTTRFPRNSRWRVPRRLEGMVKPPGGS